MIADRSVNNTDYISGVSKSESGIKSKKSKSEITVVRQISLAGLKSKDSANRLCLRRYVWKFSADSRSHPHEGRIDRLTGSTHHMPSTSRSSANSRSNPKYLADLPKDK